jgi:hypothetical protein
MLCCRLEGADAALRARMTGHARVFLGRRSLVGMLLDRGLRFLRTEVWW